MLADSLSRGFETLVLTNAMKPMMKDREELLRLQQRYGSRLTLRVYFDRYSRHCRELERGKRSWTRTIDGLQWLARHGFAINVVGPMFSDERESEVREGFVRLFRSLGVRLDPYDSVDLVLFREMDDTVDVSEITQSCWGIFNKSPDDVMYASSRMVVKRKAHEQAGGRCLHAAAVRFGIRAWPHAGGGALHRASESPPLRQVLRARRRRM